MPAPRTFEEHEAVDEERSREGQRPRHPHRRRWRRLRRRARRLVRRRRSWVLGTLAALALVAIWSLLAARAASNDLADARAALIEARESLGRADAEAADASLDAAARDLDAARSAVSRSPLALMRPLPVLGSPVKAVAAVDEAGDAMLRAGRTLTATVESFPTSGSVGVDGKDLAPFRAAALDSAQAIDAARIEFDRALTVLDGPAGASLPMVSSPAKDLAGELAAAHGQLDGVERGLTLLAELSAPETDSRLLLLSQDTMELRATGGYVGSFGIIHFDHGTVSLERYDSFESLPAPTPPMEHPDPRLNQSPWILANVNWSPDFPTTAAAAKEMFARQGGGVVDGVLGVTEDMFAEVVGELGPITVPGYDPITEEGFAERVLYEVELKRPYDVPRKKFLIELSEIVFDRVFSLDGGEVPGIVDAFSGAAGNGGAQLWFADPARQALIDGDVAAGAIPAPTGDDFLMVVDTNMSAGKANAGLVRTIDYEVAETDGALNARVTVHYRNDGLETAVNPFYNGYVRLFAPPGSELVPAGAAYDEGAADELGYKVFGADVYVEPEGGEAELVFEYRLPDHVGDGYRLDWIRQAGTLRDRLTATIGGERVEFPADGRLLHEVKVRP